MRGGDPQLPGASKVSEPSPPYWLVYGLSLWSGTKVWVWQVLSVRPTLWVGMTTEMSRGTSYLTLSYDDVKRTGNRIVL
jgi:hypothetical protein